MEFVMISKVIITTIIIATLITITPTAIIIIMVRIHRMA
jgi:hypothetical protein